ncbi:hypothetical protein LWI29_012874 [Acer saccharum]|uniref:Uncharacterized protein n=1 Tax=Acer saccharum TaxID=4024 RepID=A0AA39RLT9_ACESA|nr:hypothetical protein LWI29_012874 [Acer saccharum]
MGKIDLVVGQSLPLSISFSPSLLAAAVGDNGEDRFGGGSPSISSSFSLLAMAVALVAITQVTNQISDENPDFFPIKPMDYGRFLVISIGTGSPKIEEKYSAKMAAKWGTLGWLLHGGSVPLVDVFTQASADMVDFHISVVFQALQS